VRVGITGHQRIEDTGNVWPWVESEFRRWLRALPVDVGVSSLAAGSDQLFAEVVLDLGGQLLVVIPFLGYETRFKSTSAKRNYSRLLSRATETETLPTLGDDQIGYLHAGKRVVALSDVMVAVWDGKPAAGLGGTADVVYHALAQDIDVIHINPATRQSQRIGQGD
jgi:hypothetical protein